MSRQATSSFNLAIVNPHLAGEWHPIKNHSLHPTDVFPKAGIKVWWRCHRGHEWMATVIKRASGRGCPYCAGRRVDDTNCLASVNPTLSKQWHPTKNGALTPRLVTAGSQTKAWWLCSKSHEWLAPVCNRSNGAGCPYCSNRLVTKNKSLVKVRPDLIKEWNNSKNVSLMPDKVGAGSNKKAWWRCYDGHEWESTIYSRAVVGTGCPYCRNKKVHSKNNLKALFPEIAKEWHTLKNPDLSPNDIFAKSNKAVWWLCKKGHEWKSRVSNRTNGKGRCPYCANQRTCFDNNLAVLRPDIAKDWHPIKNGKLTPRDVVPGSEKKVWWICKRGGHVWQSMVANRTNGSKCPICNSKTSQAELRIYSELKFIFPKILHRSRINKIEIDILISDLKVGIEYDGFYWHKGKFEKDRSKNEKLAEFGISLIRIRESGLHKIDKFDISHPVGKAVDYLLICSLIKQICLLAHIDETLESRISEYLEKKKFCNESEYVELLNRLPSPLPGTSLAELNPKIAEEWHPKLNGTLTPFDVSAGSNKRVWWRCLKGHEWKTNVGGRANGRGCPYCSHLKVHDDNCLAKVNPILAGEWNFEKNGLMTPRDVLPGTDKRVWWKCKKGHEWQAALYARSVGGGCPYCLNRKIGKDNSLAMLNPALANEWHPIKNEKLTPNNVSLGYGKKVWWQCSKGHEWQTSVNKRKQGTGCPQCAGRVSEKNNFVTLLPSLAAELHPTKNNSLNPYKLSKFSETRVWWLCKQGHEWQALVSNRAKGTKCPYCVGSLPSEKNCLKSKFPKIAEEWHPTLNGDLTPETVMSRSSKKVWWLCKTGHKWKQAIMERTPDVPCPFCNKRRPSNEYNFERLRRQAASEWNHSRNNGLKPSEVLPQSNKKVWWVCVNNHEWEAMVCDRYAGSSCPFCVKQTVSD